MKKIYQIAFVLFLFPIIVQGATLNTALASPRAQIIAMPTSTLGTPPTAQPSLVLPPVEMILPSGNNFSSGLIKDNLEMLSANPLTKTFKSGQPITFEVVMRNTNSSSSFAYYQAQTKPVRLAIVANNKIRAEMSLKSIMFYAGEKQTFKITLPKTLCNWDIDLVFDYDNFMPEKTKIDNRKTIHLDCAPDQGPDYKAVSVGFPQYYFKRVGQSNKVSFTIKNEGTQAGAIPTSVLFKEGDGYFVKLLSVPALNPGKAYTAEFNYTPKSCEPLTMEVNGQRKFMETNYDNNLVAEPKAITDACKSLADLEISYVYWLGGGFSFGDPKSGENITYQADVNNLMRDANGKGCAANVAVGLYEDGKLLYKAYAGGLGCGKLDTSWGGTWGEGHWKKTVNLGYKAKCGAKIVIKADPEDAIAEQSESNNIWSQTIKCKQ